MLASFLGQIGSAAAWRLCLAACLASGSPGRAEAILGGREGGPLEASAVMVLREGGGLCSAIVIAPDVLLTAAHCVAAGRAIRVHFTDQGQPVLLEPAAVARHPEFRANAIAERTRSIDLALIRLGSPLPARFTPATLAATAEAAPGSRLVVAGFGLHRSGGKVISGQWRSAELGLVTPYGPSRILVWARGRQGEGACQGDSGGPILNADEAVVAVTSWTQGRGRDNCGDLTQGVFIAPQRGWIDESMARWSRQAIWR